MKMLHEVYEDFGFTEILYKLSTRPEKRVGSDEVWDKAEAALEEALNREGLIGSCCRVRVPSMVLKLSIP